MKNKYYEYCAKLAKGEIDGDADYLFPTLDFIKTTIDIIDKEIIVMEKTNKLKTKRESKIKNKFKKRPLKSINC